MSSEPFATPFNSQLPPSVTQFQDARRIHLKPRLGAKPGHETADVVVVKVLQFSCPSCLEMLTVPLSTMLADVRCSSCEATVTPPRIAQQTKRLPIPQTGPLR
jgi:hypothetical protein